MPLKLGKRPKIKTKKVSFEFLAPQAQEVALAGDFNDWDINSLPMKKPEKEIGKSGLLYHPENTSIFFGWMASGRGIPRLKTGYPIPLEAGIP